MSARAVILAAGESKRMGAQKLLMAYRGRPMIEHVIAAARDWEPIVVAGTEVCDYLRETQCELIENTAPERGMTHSLTLANALVTGDDQLIVLLGDKPLVSAALIRRVLEELGDADIAYPVHIRTHAPGHPVVFSPKARRLMPALTDGDTLRELREHTQLVSKKIVIDDRGAFFDIDTPDALET